MYGALLSESCEGAAEQLLASGHRSCFTPAVSSTAPCCGATVSVSRPRLPRATGTLHTLSAFRECPVFAFRARRCSPCPLPPALPAGIGAAFAILSDADKRAHYDRYGEEDAVGAAGAGGGGGGGGRDESRSRHYARYEEEISPEDIFNMFFGGGFPQGDTIFSDGRNTYRMRRGGGFGQRGQQHPAGHMHARRGEQGGDDATPVAGQRFLQLMQLLPIIILVLFTLLSFGSGPAQEERWYSLQEQEPFLVRRYTSGAGGITRDIPYYVKTDFQRRVGENRHVLPTVRRRGAGWMAVRGCCGRHEGSIGGVRQPTTSDSPPLSSTSHRL